MNFDWEDFLKVAEILHEGASEGSLHEAMYRIAISRAYYAVFCIARNRKLAEGLKISHTDNPHELVINAYKGSENHYERLIGNELSRLRKWRNRADYEDEIERVANLSSQAVKDARKIFNSLKKLQSK